MARIQRRRYGKESAEAKNTTHVLKIGFDVRRKGDARPKPQKLRGFVVCRDTLDSGNALVIDYAAMRRLNVPGEKAEEVVENIHAAIADGMKSEGILPTEICIVIVGNARRTATGDWSYPGTFDEQFLCFDKAGLFCHGDGLAALRRMTDGTKKKIDCVPVGATGATADQFCQQSVSKACKAHSRFIFTAWVPDPSTGVATPLDRQLGYNARFRFDTSSEESPRSFASVLDAAADRLDGEISGLHGVLRFGVSRARTGAEEQSVGIVGRVSLILDEGQIREREDAIRAREFRRLELSRPALMSSTAPAARMLTSETEPEDEAAAFAEQVAAEKAFILDDSEQDEPRDEPVPPPIEVKPEPIDDAPTLMTLRALVDELETHANMRAIAEGVEYGDVLEELTGAGGKKGMRSLSGVMEAAAKDPSRIRGAVAYVKSALEGVAP